MKTYNNILAVCITVLLLLSSPFAIAVSPSLKGYEASAGKIVDGLTARDPAPFNQSIAADTILDNAFEGLFLDAKWEADFRKGLKQAITTRLGAKLISKLPDGAYAKLLRVKMEGKEGRALMRLDYGDDGSGYMDMHLAQASDGAVQIVDWYDYSTGQLYTQSLRQVIATLSPTPTVLGKVFDIASNRKANADVIVKFMQLNNAKKFEEMVHYFLSLDESYRKSRLLNIIVFQAASQLNDMDLYQKVLANIEHYYSDDSTMAFVLLDYYYLEGQYGKVVRSADQLMKSFGVEDANLLVIKANALVEEKKYDAAVRQAKRAIALEPNYEYGYWSLITIQLAQKSYNNAVETGKSLESRFGYELSPAALAQNPIYAGFIESAEYRSWKQQ